MPPPVNRRVHHGQLGSGKPIVRPAGYSRRRRRTFGASQSVCTLRLWEEELAGHSPVRPPISEGRWCAERTILLRSAMRQGSHSIIVVANKVRGKPRGLGIEEAVANKLHSMTSVSSNMQPGAR